MTRITGRFLCLALLAACGNPFDGVGDPARGDWRATLDGTPYDSIHLDVVQNGRLLTGSATAPPVSFRRR